ncbi:MAG: hypothetical protein ACD_60C00028G0051 [uncultured bacterium]|nr:MAG: hypothetical protein ACD_60C00028G0051 [uncultured bacterium]
MKILVLGGDGMLGHQLLLNLQKRHHARATLRQDKTVYEKYRLFDEANSYFGVDVRGDDYLEGVLSHFKPDAVINAVGVIKQRQMANDAIPNIEINALFPHRLAILCKKIGARMIHFSTDCVFSGKKGKYTENDLSDAYDFYGKSKYLGEVHEPHCLTLRSSVIGLELAHKASLIEWFLARHGVVKGFRQAIYTGLTTQEMSRVIELVLVKHPTLSGVLHVSSSAISKYDLLMYFSELLHLKEIQIEPDDQFVCDRSLQSDVFCGITGYKAPTWASMLSELADQVKERERMTECAV